MNVYFTYDLDYIKITDLVFRMTSLCCKSEQKFYSNTHNF